MCILSGDASDARTVAAALNAASLALLQSGLPLRATIATVCIPLDSSDELLSLTFDLCSMTVPVLGRTFLLDTPVVKCCKTGLKCTPISISIILFTQLVLAHSFPPCFATFPHFFPCLISGAHIQLIVFSPLSNAAIALSIDVSHLLVHRIVQPPAHPEVGNIFAVYSSQSVPLTETIDSKSDKTAEFSPEALLRLLDPSSTLHADADSLVSYNDQALDLANVMITQLASFKVV